MTASHSVESQLASIGKAERHMKSEYGTNMVGVMDTVGSHPHFVMPLGPNEVTVLSGWDNIDAMYKASVNNAVPKASRILTQLATDWYVFIENVPTRYWIGPARPITAQTVTMFVTDDEKGITGEYAWQRNFPSMDAAASDDELPLPERSLANLEKHEKLLAAVCAGDVETISALLSADCIWAQRDYLNETEGGKVLNLKGSVAAADYVSRWHEAMQPQHVSIVNRRVTDWFVFSEELWLLRPGGGKPRQCRTATIYPLDKDGMFEGALGFGREMEDPAPSALTKHGHAFWTEPGVAIADVERG